MTPPAQQQLPLKNIREPQNGAAPDSPGEGGPVRGNAPLGKEFQRELLPAHVIALSQILQSPHSYTGQRLLVRGFLYQAPDQRWVLSTEPGLRTCCVGAAERAHQQMEVFGEMTGHTVGIASVLDGRVEIAELARVQLHDAKVYPEHLDGFCPLCIGAMLLLLLSLCLFFVKNILYTKESED